MNLATYIHFKAEFVTLHQLEVTIPVLLSRNIISIARRFVNDRFFGTVCLNFPFGNSGAMSAAPFGNLMIISLIPGATSISAGLPEYTN